MLSQTLSVSPNWLIFGTEDSQTDQAALEVFRGGNNLVSAFRLGLAITVLRPHERGAFTSLVLSMAGRELGDMKLSALLALGAQISDAVIEELKGELPDDISRSTPTDQALESMVRRWAEGVTTNIGNKIILDEDGDPVGGTWTYPEPKK